jgi:hypothetical protein
LTINLQRYGYSDSSFGLRSGIKRWRVRLTLKICHNGNHRHFEFSDANWIDFGLNPRARRPRFDASSSWRSTSRARCHHLRSCCRKHCLSGNRQPLPCYRNTRLCACHVSDGYGAVSGQGTEAHQDTDRRDSWQAFPFLPCQYSVGVSCQAQYPCRSIGDPNLV